MRGKSVVWIPVLFVGALLYWTLAFGFGGMSLMAFTLYQDCIESSDDGLGGTLRDSYQSITVNLSDLPSSDIDSVEGISASETAPVTVDLVSDREAAVEQGGQGARGGGQRRDQGPGHTAF